VVGFRLGDNILNKKEIEFYRNGFGVAYQVPWNSCALWNKKFVYGKGQDQLRFDEICDENQFGKAMVKLGDNYEATNYEGMEDGLAIAELATKNPELKFKLLEEELYCNVLGDEEVIKKHKIKMARKNLVLSFFINIKGYSSESLRKAKLQ